MIWRDWTPRQKKQTKIAVMYLVLFAFIGWGLWNWIVPPPEPPEPKGPQIEPLQVLESDFISLRPGKVDVYARIQNPNNTFGASAINYTWQLYDRSGNLIQEKSGRDFILPQSTKILIQQSISTQQEVARVDVQLGNTQWVGVKEYTPPRLFITRKNMKVPQSPGQGNFALEGEVRNGSNFDFSRVVVKTLLKDTTGEVIAVGTHEMNTVVSGENRFFRVAWFDPLAEEPAQAQTVAETNVFANDNFIEAKGGPLESFQLP